MAVVDLKTLLGAVIRTERSALGISQEELANRAGLHRTYVSDLERGARNPSLESVEKLAQALDLSVSTLFQRTNPGNGAKQLVDILLVEDNSRDVELTKLAFAKARFTNPLHVARDGVEALEFISGTGRHAHRSGLVRSLIILLALNLPKKSALEILREIRRDARTREIPVIVLTASSRDRDIGECRRLGVETYIVKPVGFENFSGTTRRFHFDWGLMNPISR
jgi:two-component system response regulator